MSLSSALSIALTGLNASTTAAQVISGNISNAQTAGYTEKSVQLSESQSGSGAGGVAVSGYSRITDTVLTATLNTSTSNASYLSTQNSYMTEVQSMLDSSSNPPALSSAMSNFQAAWTELSADASNSTAQKAVVSAAQTLTSTVSSIASQASTLQTQVQSDLSTTVATLNSDLANVQTLNTQISTAMANNQPTGDLEDERDAAINGIAAITNVQVMSRPNGAVALYTAAGSTLLDGAAQTFTAVGNNVVNAIGANVNAELSGGKLQAQTDFLSSSTSAANGVGVVGKITSQLQNLAVSFVNTASGGFASTYNSATTATGEQASSFFTATIESNGLPDLSTFAVNASLVAGTTTVKAASATSVANTFSATNLAINPATSTTTSTFSATGLSTNNQTYSGIVSAILSASQQAANTIQTASTAASTQQTYYKNALSSETGVNTDDELVNLTNWQNAYAASAHVISTIQSMFTTLENMVS